MRRPSGPDETTTRQDITAEEFQPRACQSPSITRSSGPMRHEGSQPTSPPEMLQPHFTATRSWIPASSAIKTTRPPTQPNDTLRHSLRLQPIPPANKVEPPVSNDDIVNAPTQFSILSSSANFQRRYIQQQTTVLQISGVKNGEATEALRVDL